MRKTSQKLLLSIGINNARGQFATAKDIIASGKLKPAELGVCPKLFAGHSEQEQLTFAAGIVNALQLLQEDPNVYYIVGNAYAPSAGGAGTSSGGLKDVCGHCYCGMEAKIIDIPATQMNLLAAAKNSSSSGRNNMKDPESMVVVKEAKTVLESTKWVNPIRAFGSKNRIDPQVTQLQNQCASLLGEITKVSSIDPADDLISTRLEVCLDKAGDDSAFYAMSYIHDDKSMFSYTVPGTNTSSLVFGVSMDQYIDGNEKLLFSTKRSAYELVTRHLQKAGLTNIKSGEIKEKVVAGALAAAIPAWPKEAWERNVFDTYIPCSILYEDRKVLKSLFSMGLCKEGYSPIVFAHECTSEHIQLDCENNGSEIRLGAECRGVTTIHSHPRAQEYVQNILSVLHEGVAPPITQVHADRILTKPCFKGMDMEKEKHRIKTFDAKAVNQSIQGKLKGLVKVARISTQMGCLTTLCVVNNKDLQAVNDILVTWAKPIVAAQQLKGSLGMEWRMKLEKLGPSVAANASQI